MIQKFLKQFLNKFGFLNLKLETSLDQLNLNMIAARQAVAQTIATRDHIRKQIYKARKNLDASIEKAQSCPDKSSQKYKVAIEIGNRYESEIKDYGEQLKSSQELIDETLTKLIPLEELVSILDLHVQFIWIISPVTTDCPLIPDLKTLFIDCTEYAIDPGDTVCDDKFKIKNIEKAAHEYYSKSLETQLAKASTDKISKFLETLNEFEPELLAKLPKLKEESNKWKLSIDSSNKPLKLRSKEKLSTCLRKEERIEKMLAVIDNIKLYIDLT